jgi:hypothetical protein
LIGAAIFEPVESSNVSVDRGVLLGFGVVVNKGFDMADGFGSQKGIGTYIANLGRNVLEDKDVFAAFHGMDDSPLLVFARTAFDRAIHLSQPLSKGLTHFGRFGSYAVIIIASSSEVVHTTWT